MDVQNNTTVEYPWSHEKNSAHVCTASFPSAKAVDLRVEALSIRLMAAKALSLLGDPWRSRNMLRRYARTPVTFAGQGLVPGSQVEAQQPLGPWMFSVQAEARASKALEADARACTVVLRPRAPAPPASSGLGAGGDVLPRKWRGACGAHGAGDSFRGARAAPCSHAAPGNLSSARHQVKEPLLHWACEPASQCVRGMASKGLWSTEMLRKHCFVVQGHGSSSAMQPGRAKMPPKLETCLAPRLLTGTS